MSETNPGSDSIRPPLSAGEILGRARAILHANLYSVLIVNALFGLLALIAYTASLLFVMEFLVGELAWTYREDYQNALLSLLALPVITYGITGLLHFYTRLARGEKPDWSILFQYHRGYIYMLLFWLCYYVLYFFLVRVAVRGALEPERFELEILVRMAAGFLFFLWLFVRLMFAPQFIVDGRSNLRQASRRSWMLTSGRTRRTAWLTLFFLVVAMVGVLFLGAGAVYTFGLAMLAYALVFDRLSHPEPASGSAG